MVKTEPAVASTRLLGLRWKLYPSNMACMLNRDLIRAESFSSTLKSSKRKKGCTGKVIIFKQTWNEQKFGIETFSHLHTKSSLFFLANRNDHSSSNFTRTGRGRRKVTVGCQICSLRISPHEGIQHSLGFWIPCRGFLSSRYCITDFVEWNLDSRFHSEWDSGFQILFYCLCRVELGF